MSTYRFANPEHTLVRCVDDGATFEIERNQHPSSINGFAAERWRAAGCPTPVPHRESAVTPDDQARARRRSAGDDARRRVS